MSTIFKNFYEDSRINLVPVKMELVVGDEDYGLGGMVDCLFYNKKSDMLEVWDYKTNKAINIKNNYGQTFKEPISTFRCLRNKYLFTTIIII